jgi:hypothetical protein
MKDPDSDLANLIKDAGCGETVPPERTTELADVVCKTYRDLARWEKMDPAGRVHAIEHYFRLAVTRPYHDLFQRVVNV